MIARSPVSEAHAACFLSLRPRLFGIASRVLGRANDADDVVQDTWIRWQRSDRTSVRDPAVFLATTTTRLAINVTQSAWARRETHIEPDVVAPVDTAADPALTAQRREALGLAVGVLLANLSPAERAVYLLREAFDYPYRQIAQALGLGEDNARQLAARARRRLADERRRPVAAPERQPLLHALVAAVHTGDVATLRAAARLRSGHRRWRGPPADAPDGAGAP